MEENEEETEEEEEEDEKAKLEEVLKRLEGRPLLREFALHLSEGSYSAGDIEALLCGPWDGAYPTRLLGEDLLMDMSNFLYEMASFATIKVYGENYWVPRNRCIRVVADPSYQSQSYVYVLELATRSILAALCCGKTWHYNSEALEKDLKGLIDQLEKSKNMLALRMIVEDERGGSA